MPLIEQLMWLPFLNPPLNVGTHIKLGWSVCPSVKSFPNFDSSGGGQSTGAVAQVFELPEAAPKLNRTSAISCYQTPLFYHKPVKISLKQNKASRPCTYVESNLPIPWKMPHLIPQQEASGQAL